MKSVWSHGSGCFWVFDFADVFINKQPCQATYYSRWYRIALACNLVWMRDLAAWFSCHTSMTQLDDQTGLDFCQCRKWQLFPFTTIIRLVCPGSRPPYMLEIPMDISCLQIAKSLTFRGLPCYEPTFVLPIKIKILIAFRAGCHLRLIRVLFINTSRYKRSPSFLQERKYVHHGRGRQVKILYHDWGPSWIENIFWAFRQCHGTLWTHY